MLLVSSVTWPRSDSESSEVRTRMSAYAISIWADHPHSGTTDLDALPPLLTSSFFSTTTSPLLHTYTHYGTHRSRHLLDLSSPFSPHSFNPAQVATSVHDSYDSYHPYDSHNPQRKLRPSQMDPSHSSNITSLIPTTSIPQTEYTPS